MLTFISCAKTMATPAKVAALHTPPQAYIAPNFASEAAGLARRFAGYSAEELAGILSVSPAIAASNRERFRAIVADDAARMPALSAYTGMVFRHIDAPTLTAEAITYAQGHLLITSFLYGLLRPLDLISPYRLEGKVRLADEPDEPSLFAWWRPRLTEWFIKRIQEAGGTLVNLASAEMQQLFDWQRVCREVRVVTPEFYVRRGDKLKVVTVYAKQCRGEMTRFILTQRPDTPEALCTWSALDFHYAPCPEADSERLIFIREEA